MGSYLITWKIGRLSKELVTSMLYLAAYLIRGEAGDWHRRLTGEIAEKFGVLDLAKRIPPHLTLFPPTDLSDPGNMKKVVSRWTEQLGAHSRPDMVLNGLGYWGRRVVYAEISVSESIRQRVAELRAGLDEELGTAVQRQTWLPHASLARKSRSEKIDRVREYVSGLEKPYFILPLDQAAVLRYQDGKWEEEEVFEIR